MNCFSSDYQYLQVKADDFIISTSFLSFMPHIIKYFLGTRRYNLTNLTSMYTSHKRKEGETDDDTWFIYILLHGYHNTGNTVLLNAHLS